MADFALTKIKTISFEANQNRLGGFVYIYERNVFTKGIRRV